MSIGDAADLYKILQVDPAADPEIIQAAYHRLARKHHPDVAPDPGAANRMAAINRAWEVLGDPGRRAAYDARRALGGDGSTAETRASEPPGASPVFGAASRSRPRAPQETDPNWSSGRSTFGGGYDPSTMRAPEGTGAAGPPPGSPSGSVLNFGRYAAWSLGEIARRDPDYLEWLDRMPIGRPYREEIDAILRRLDRRRTASGPPDDQRGLFRRR